MDEAVFNDALNKLKQIVGDQGAFVLFLTTPEVGQNEVVKVRMWGPRTRVEGVFSVGSRIMIHTTKDYDGNFERQHDPD